MQPFVHLHVHTQYSVLDGQASIPSLVDKAIADGQPGLAITDHGNMFGIKEYFNLVNKVNSKRKEQGLEPFKAIFGCELYVAKKSLNDRADKSDKGYHLIALAKNATGYHNLIKIVSKAWTDGFYHHPRTDKKELAEHHEGIIICSACLGGEIPRLIRAGQLDEAEKAVLWYKEVFGDDYYIEIQRHKATVPNANHETFVEQQHVNAFLIEFAHKHNIKIVATNDVHFTNEDDAEAHDRLVCVATNHFLSDSSRMLYTKQEWMKTTEEMNRLFADIPEALSNTLEVLNKVETYTIDHKPILPNFPLPDGFTDNDDYLRHLTYQGAYQRWGQELTDEQKERIDFELDTIKNMGFPGYFLIVQDFIKAGRERGVSIGPGRGSAAGSAVAYCLGITQIDPIKYDLLFERFLNPDRISLPDIDIDFDDDGRSDVLAYVTEKYGAEKVARIITYGTMAAKSAIKDVARVEQLPLAESNRLANLVPKRMPEVDGKELKCTLKNCYKHVPEFAPELQSDNPLVRNTLKYALQLEGNVRNTGVHACGVIICRDAVSDWVPLSIATDKETNMKMLVTQYEGSVIEETGLIKMDFLGLKTLSIIKDALYNIKQTRGFDLDIGAIDITDPATYRLYSEGRTVGTFQFESAGMQKYLRELQPSTFEDLIAMNALYRPGPMDYIPDFIARKHGRSPITYDIPEMEKYLKDTYGVTVYQEQVMLLSRLLANFTRGESDTLRKAMGKKLIEKMNHLKGKFLEGGQANGHKAEVLEKIWKDWEKFASYAFNKSHATCYSWVAFQTAYLKANFPAEYMAAVLSRNMGDKLSGFMDECKRMKINVKGPDVNESFSNFGVNKDGDIRYGLAAIKGIGEGIVNAIIEERQANGPFQNIYDFIERVPLSAGINRRTIENFALAGAFDCFGDDIKRWDFFEVNTRDENFAEQLVKYGQLYQRDRQQQAASLFDDFADPALDTSGRPAIKPAIPWVQTEVLSKERELVGRYLSAHPLDPFYMELTYATTSIKDFTSEDFIIEEGKEIVLGGMATKFETRPGKNGPWGILTLEDHTGSCEIRLFGQTYSQFNGYCTNGQFIRVIGKYQRRFREGELRFNIVSIARLDDLKNKVVKGIAIRVTTDRLNDTLVGLLKDHSHNYKENPGELHFTVYDPKLNRAVNLAAQRTIPINKDLVDMLDSENIDYKIIRQ
ncbi:MAG: DNA polymerase III subunit alpha [Bacteroides sp.]|nr:DNA polymerase III subunit alpha [Bacteroides sp.]MCM1379386.1 DNA polymerase III subunit alpha [Bacteroides sp.]MCM1445246.1 DNA polymerase III subunit alpha [Prevotella sp.]